MPSAATCQPLSSDGIVSVQEPSATAPLTPAHVMQVIYLEVFLFFLPFFVRRNTGTHRLHKLWQTWFYGRS